MIRHSQAPIHLGRPVLIFGSREWEDEKYVFELVLQLRASVGGLVIMHGDAKRGVDNMVRRACEQIGVDEIRCPANWAGRSRQIAGSHRNMRMAMLAPEQAFGIRAAGKSNGTDNMANWCERYGIPLTKLGHWPSLPAKRSDNQ